MLTTSRPNFRPAFPVTCAGSEAVAEKLDGTVPTTVGSADGTVYIDVFVVE
jgi:hypothetical protein